MSDDKHSGNLGKRDTSARPWAAAIRLLLLALAAGLSLAGMSGARERDGDPVERLREALEASYPNPAERNRALGQALADLRSLSDLQNAVLLLEWRDSSGDAVDKANYDRLLKWFHASVRRILHGTDAPAVSAMCARLDEMAASARGSGDSLTVVRAIGPDLADLVRQGPSSVRGTAARTLARIEPPIFIAVPALSELLQDGDPALRRIAADCFATLIQNALQGANGGITEQRAARRSELALTASSVLPAIHRGLDDARPEVRRRCLETIGLAAAALTRLLEDSSASRISQAEREEWNPLLLALRDQGPILTHALGDNDLETRVRAFKALEEMGLARSRWFPHRSHPEGGGDPLGEVLIGALPEMTTALRHPETRVRRAALDALEMCGSLALPAVPALTRALHDPDRFVRWSAVRIVGKLGPAVAPQTAADLTRLLHDPDLALRKAAAAALARVHSSPIERTTESQRTQRKTQ